MKILFVHNEYQYKGGEDTVLEMESSLLQQKGHAVKTLLFSNMAITSFTAKIRMGFQSLYNAGSALQLKEAIANFQPDVIHVHNLFFQASPSILYCAQRMNIPVVMTVHNYRFICANALLLRDNHVCELCIQKKFPVSGIRYKCYRSSAIESALVTGITGAHKLLHTWNKKIHTLIALSSFMKEKLVHSSLHFPADKIVIKPNFVHDPGHLQVPRDNYFLFVGRLASEKGIHALLECFKSRPQHQLVIAGDGPLKELVMETARTVPGITYVGQQPKEKVRELMQKARALIFPSIWYEGLPLTIIEAFATGTPVIAAKLGAMAEMVRDGENGFHFIPGDAADLANVLENFGNLSFHHPVYENARQTWQQLYSPDAHYESIMQIYENAIRNRQQAGVK